MRIFGRTRSTNSEFFVLLDLLRSFASKSIWIQTILVPGRSKFKLFLEILIEHILILNDLEIFLVENPLSSDTSESKYFENWDTKARAGTGLSLPNYLLENFRDVPTAKDTWTAIRNVFERHTLSNKITATKKFYPQQ